MEILLSILAIIGIILLCLIGLVLLVAGLVLFAPIRYRFWAKVAEKQVAGSGRISWLFPLIAVSGVYEGESVQVVVRILGIPIRRMKFDVKNPMQNTEMEEPVVGEETETPQDMPEAGGRIEESAVEPCPIETENGDQRETGEEVTEPTPAENPTEEALEGAKEESPQKEKFTFSGLCDKIKKALADFAYYKDLLQKAETVALWNRCKKRVFRILRYLKPTKLKGEFTIGTGAPDTTGYLLAIYGILLPFLGYDMNIHPDFEQAIFQGEVSGKGRIRLFPILWNGGAILFDKQLPIFWKKLKREET